MTAIDTGLQDLKRQHPEWEPWLAVVQEVLTEATNSEWDACVPVRNEAQQSKVPLLAGTTLALPQRSVHRLLEKLIRIAHRSGTREMATLEPVLHADLDFLNLFKASLCQDSDRIKKLPLTWAQTRRRSSCCSSSTGPFAECLQSPVGFI